MFQHNIGNGNVNPLRIGSTYHTAQLHGRMLDNYLFNTIRKHFRTISIRSRCNKNPFHSTGNKYYTI